MNEEHGSPSTPTRQTDGNAKDKSPRASKKRGTALEKPPTLGLGTVGLGSKCSTMQDDLSRNQYKEWKAKKAEQEQQSRAKRDDEPGPLSPRQLCLLSKQLKARRQEEQEERQREVALRNSKERQSVREHWLENKDVDMMMTKRSVALDRKYIRERRKTAIAQYTGQKAIEFKSQRDKMKEERAQWRQLLEDEKKEEEQRIQQIREKHALVSQAAAEERVLAEESRLREIAQLKEQQKAKVEQWRHEQHSEDTLRKEITQHRKRDVDTRTARGVRQNQQERRQLVDEARTNELAIKREVERRRHDYDTALHEMVAERKKEFISHYTLRLKEIQDEKAMHAEEVRQTSARHKEMVKQEQAERAATARARAHGEP